MRLKPGARTGPITLRITVIKVNFFREVHAAGNPIPYRARAFCDLGLMVQYVWGRTHQDAVLKIEEWAKRRGDVVFVNGAVTEIACAKRATRPVSA